MPTLVVFAGMLPYDSSHWYYGIGCLSVCVLFNVVSIPLMEKRQLARRPDYEVYKTKTSRLILWPQKNKNSAGIKPDR